MQLERRLELRLVGTTVTLMLAVAACARQQNVSSNAEPESSGRTADVRTVPDSSTYNGNAGRVRDTPEVTASAANPAAGIPAREDEGAFGQRSMGRVPAGWQGAVGRGNTSTDEGNTAISQQAQSFMLQAAQDGEFELQAGQLAASKANSDAIKSFAQDMVRDHSQANQDLMHLAQRKGIRIQAQLDATHEAKLRQLERLSGTAFDRAYAQEMDRSHRQALQLFERAAQNLPDPDVKAFAQRTLPTLRDHLRMAGSLPAAKRG